jgi:NAD(P)-dependent dehydrogenase (short-subunit alcohol dehydrogenase family)
MDNIPNMGSVNQTPIQRTDLAEQVAIVTGASRGIGQAVAIRLGRLGAIVDVTESQYVRIYSVNSKGAFFTLQQAALTVNRGGSIVYIGSGTTLAPVPVPVPGFALYATSKLPGSYFDPRRSDSLLTPQRSAIHESNSWRWP